MNTQRPTPWRGYAQPTTTNRATNYKPGVVAWDKSQPRVRVETRRPQPVHTGYHPAFKPKVQPRTQNSQYNAFLANMQRYNDSMQAGPGVAYGRIQNHGQSKSFLNRIRWTECRDTLDFAWLTYSMDSALSSSYSSVLECIIVLEAASSDMLVHALVIFYNESKPLLKSSFLVFLF